MVRSALLLLAVSAALAGCAADESESPTAPPASAGTSAVTPSAPNDATPTTSEPITVSPLLTVTISGHELLPEAEAIDLDVGEPLLIEITSDRPGQLRVHSSPAQRIDFSTGTAHTQLVIDRPGRVEIKERDSGAVLAVLTVR